MPGANCVFPGCTVSRTDKHKDIGIFKVPTRKDEFHSDWRKNLINVITRYRENDTALKDQITAGNVYICERHFSSGDIELTSELLSFCIFFFFFAI